MSTAGDIASRHRFDARRTRQQLLRAVRQALPSNGCSGLKQVTVPMPPTDVLAWLDAQPQAERAYWSDRNGEHEIAAVGAADIQWSQAPVRREELARTLRAGSFLEGGRYIGGARFDSGAASEERWQPFGTFRFVLPRLELHRTPEGTLLRYNLRPSHDDRAAVEALVHQVRLHPPASSPVALAAPVARTDAPGRPAWEATVGEALEAIATTPLEKVVLARVATFTFAAPLAPLTLLRLLKAATPNCFHFAFQSADGPAFVGASPELLFAKEGTRVHSEAVAGTRPRVDDPTADDRLRRALLQSDKDRREHAFVRERIRRALAPLTQTLTVEEEPSELRLARKRHLQSAVEGRLQKGVDVWDLLGTLHPTPAVGGTPTDAALQHIRAVEPLDRGWYAGPVGWVQDDAAAFAVGIRSGLVDGADLSLFSGAGIVAGSDPAAEWQEIEHKISDFIDVLGLDPRRS